MEYNGRLLENCLESKTSPPVTNEDRMTLENFIQYLLQGMALGLPAAATPGPFQTYLINQTLSGGWRRSAPIAFVPLISDIPAVIAILLLLNQLPKNFLQVISLVGGVFVLYMAWGLWRHWRTRAAGSMQGSSHLDPAGGFWRGVVMNLLSPGLYAFWALVSGPILLSALQQSWIYGAAFLFGFYGTLIGGFLGIVILFHQAHRLGSSAVRTLTLVSIIILVIFGGLLLYRGVV
ncbi:MAG: LysE family translocator [Anaerolineales bacterium]|nr:LysE family translocator [Anaerolineales bacterium]